MYNTISTTINKTFKCNSEFESQYVENNLELKVIGKDNLDLKLNIYNVKFYDFHPNNSKIFFVCVGKVEIYKISDDYSKIEKISEIKDYSNKIVFASFNPFEDNMVATISENQVLKIWDIRNNDIKSYKELNNGKIKKRIRWENGKLIYNVNDEIIIYDYNNDKTISNLKIQCRDFYFFDTEHIIIINIKNGKLRLEIFSLKGKEQFKYEIKDKVIKFIYLFNFESLIVFNYSNITAFSIINNNNNYEIKEIYKDEIEMDLSIFDYSFSPLKNNYISLNLYLYNFEDNTLNKSCFKIPITKDKITNKFDINKIKKKVIDFKELNLNLIENKFINNYKKNYFNLKIIQDELIKIKKDNLLERSDYVKNNIEKIKKIEVKHNSDIKNKYIEILKLLIRDNTIKGLIEIYLSFIKENEKYLRTEFKNNFEDFKEEKEAYSPFFDEEEFFKKFNEKKTTQKSMILDILDKIVSLKEIKEENLINVFINEADHLINKYSKNLCFNHPINDEESQELMYLNNKLIILYDFKNQISKYNDSKIEKKKREKDLKNTIKIYIYEFAKIKESINNNASINYINHLFICAACSDTIKNFDYNLSNINNNNYNDMIKNPPNKLDLNKIKNFLIRILNSKCLETAFKAIYGENEDYMFNNNDYNKYYVENYINFLPIKGSLYAVTDKFTLKCYLISLSPDIIGGHFLDDLILLEYAGIIFTTLHELGHIVVNHLYYMSNCSRSIETPRNEKIKECEGGRYFEFALFGDLYNGINIRQGMFLLKENNYLKDYKEFQADFEILKDDNLVLSKENEFYKEFEKCNEILNYSNLSKAIVIKSKTGEDVQLPYISLRNDSGMMICYKDC